MVHGMACRDGLCRRRSHSALVVET